MDLENPNNGDSSDRPSPHPDDNDSTCSTPYVSAPSSPGRGGLAAGYFFSAPASPMHYVLSSAPFSVAIAASTSSDLTFSGSFEFDYPAAAGAAAPAAATADELFLNGQIRPMKLSSHLQRPQTLAPLLDVGDEEEEEPEVMRGREMRLRSRSLHRRARSVSPMRNSHFEEKEKENRMDLVLTLDMDPKPDEEAETTGPPEAASSSRSSSSGRNSKRWVFIKDLLYRSKSEGSSKTGAKEKFWHSFSPTASKDKLKSTAADTELKQKKAESAVARPTNGVGKRRSAAPSAHERHYTENRAVAEGMRRRTFLPYRQGLLGSLGCLGFSSRGYGAVNGFARSLNPVSSRSPLRTKLPACRCPTPSSSSAPLPPTRLRRRPTQDEDHPRSPLLRLKDRATSELPSASAPDPEAALAPQLRHHLEDRTLTKPTKKTTPAPACTSHLSASTSKPKTTLTHPIKAAPSRRLDARNLSPRLSCLKQKTTLEANSKVPI